VVNFPQTNFNRPRSGSQTSQHTFNGDDRPRGGRNFENRSRRPSMTHQQPVQYTVANSPPHIMPNPMAEPFVGQLPVSLQQSFTVIPLAAGVAELAQHNSAMNRYNQMQLPPVNEQVSFYKPGNNMSWDASTNSHYHNRQGENKSDIGCNGMKGKENAPFKKT